MIFEIPIYWLIRINNKDKYLLVEKLISDIKLKINENRPFGMIDEREIKVALILINWIKCNHPNLPIPSDIDKLITNSISSFSDRSDFPGVPSNYLVDDYFGAWYQQILTSSFRKKNAVNYTSNSLKIIETLVEDEIVVFSILDPFSGTGRLITATINYLIKKRKIKKLNLVSLNDNTPLAVLIAFCRVLQLKKKYKLNFKIDATIGEAFKLNKVHDFIITNPPFTRSHYITNDQKELIREISNKYDNKITGQAGLHYWSFFLINDLIADDGKFLMVIPESLIMSRYSASFKQVLINNYGSIKFLSSKSSISLSDGSELTEIALYASKKDNISSGVKFYTVDKDFKFININNQNQKIIANDWNWSRYFRNNKLLECREILFNDTEMISLEAVPIKRGIEMYGSNFFFIPNKTWKISFDGNIFKLKTKNQTLNMDKKHLQLCLRKSKNYFQIKPDLKDYVLYLNPEAPIDDSIQSYIDYTKEDAKVAINKFGDDWIYHTYNQIKVKNPKAHLFITDKIGLLTARTLIHYYDDEIYCTKNFYVVQLDKIRSKLIAAWMFSSWYLLLYMSSRRIIGGSFGRLQIVDYQNEKLFPERLFSISLNTNIIQKIISKFDEINNIKLTAIPDQIGENYRFELDVLFRKLFKFSISVDELYKIINIELGELKLINLN